MQINENCIRDVLGCIINAIDYKRNIDKKMEVVSISLSKLYSDQKLSKTYEEKDIMYSVLKLLEIRFIKVSDIFPENKSVIERCTICEVTYAGHKFYETIQPESIWEKTKLVVNKVGNHTLNFIETVAHDVAVESAKEMISNLTKPK